MEKLQRPRALWRRQEAAQILGISISQLDKMIRAGQLATIRIGERGIRISQTDIDRLAASGR